MVLSSSAVVEVRSDISTRWGLPVYAISIGTNACTTALVAYKFWCVKRVDILGAYVADPPARAHRKTIQQSRKQSSALNALFLMLESGVLYILLQVRRASEQLIFRKLTEW